MTKIFLIQNFKNLGKKGDKLKVKYGYAINYLIPKKIAIIINKNVENFNLIETNLIQTDKILIYKNLIDKIKELKIINIYYKSNKNGKLFGSIKRNNILNIIKKINNIDFINIKNINILNTKNNIINKIGKYIIEIKKFNIKFNFELNIN